jgi:hypothetical protein
MNRVNGRFALALMASALLLAAACARVPEPETRVTTKTGAGTSTALPAAEVAARKNALVRFVHAMPGLAAADLFAGDAKAFAGVAYKAATAYQELPGAKGVFRLRLAGQDSAEPLAEQSEGFGAGGYHTIVAVPARGMFAKAGGAELRFLTDEFEAPAAGKAKVRVVNASPDLDELDLYVSGRAEPVVKGAKFGAASDFAEGEPSAAGVEVRRAGENITTLSVPGMKIEAGGLYTVFVVGGTKGAANLEAFVVEDRLGGAQ